MPIISKGDRGGWSGKLAVWFIYFALTIGGISMAYPFLVTLTGSVSSDFDYDRRSPFPRFLVSRQERFMRVVCAYYPPQKRVAMKELRSAFPDWPKDWLTWRHAGEDVAGAKAWATTQLNLLRDPATRPYLQTMALDYHAFMETLTIPQCTLSPDSRYMSPFLRERYHDDLKAFNQAWEVAADDFTEVPLPPGWINEAYYHHSYLPANDARHEDMLALYRQYKEDRYLEFLKDDSASMSPLRPADLAFTWEEFARKELKIDDPEELRRLPFPVPADAKPSVVEAWHKYLKELFPLRYVRIPDTPEYQAKFVVFMRDRFRNIAYFNDIVLADVPDWQPITSWEQLQLTATVPKEGPVAKAWMSFVNTDVPTTDWQILETLPDKAFQHFALDKYGSLAEINTAYGVQLDRVEQLRIPSREALLVTFDNHEWAFTWHLFTRNYRMVLDYLILRGRAAFNTVVLVLLTMLITLTVNPLAGYALSRFQLPQTEKILIFCLATMAFPAAVAAIPGFLLLRDLSLLNSFAALVLPGAANGMGIFLLKGFFDSLPQELYEAATIDGAPEWQIFVRISLPLVKPILAVNLLHAFIAAYSGWAWAIIVCQDQKMWTIAVWTYQFSQLFATQPYAIMAAYMITSLPVFLVFFFCQNIIMRGIILPQMK